MDASSTLAASTNLKMKASIKCLVAIEFDRLSEYEALDEVYKMVDKSSPIGNEVNMRIEEIITASSKGCSITYSEVE
jgi:hypothetical protein